MASPTDVAGLNAWFKADAIVGLVDADPVATWVESQSAADATQGTSGQRPVYKTAQINGLPAVRFDGTDDNLTSAASSSLAATTVFAVVNPTATATYRTIRGTSTGGNALQFRITDTDKQELVDEATALVGTGTNAVTEGSFQVVAATFSDAANAWAFYRNGTADGSGSYGSTLAAARTTTLGRNGNSAVEFLIGDLAELIVYDSMLSAGDRAIVHTYLQDKYGITVSDYVSSTAAATGARRSQMFHPGAGVLNRARFHQSPRNTTVPAGAILDGDASLTGTASITSTASLAQPITATLTGTATITAAATVALGGAATLTGTGAITGTASVTANATSSLTGTGSWTATAANQRPATASLTGTGTFTAAATTSTTQSGTASLTGTGSITAAATVTRSASASLTGTATISPTAAVTANATTSLTGTGAWTVTSSVGAAASITGTGTWTAAATPIRNGSASLTGTATLTATATVTRSVAAAFTGTGVIAPTATAVVTTTTSLTGVATVTATATVSALTTPGQMYSREAASATMRPAQASGPRMDPLAVAGPQMTGRELAASTMTGGSG